MSWEDESEGSQDAIGSMSLHEGAEAFLSHLSSSSSLSFVAGGGSAASGSPNRLRGAISDSWDRLAEWNEAGQNIEVEGCSSFKAVWMRGHFSLGLPLPASMAIASGNEEIDSYWLISDRWLQTEQWEAVRKLLHEAFLKLGAADGSTHLSGAITLPGMKRHMSGMQAELIQLANLPADPTSYSLQELAEAFGLELPVIEKPEAPEQTPKEIPPARGKVKKALAFLADAFAASTDVGGKGGQTVSVSELMEVISMTDRENFRRSILNHPAFVRGLDEFDLVYVSVIGRGRGSYFQIKEVKN